MTRYFWWVLLLLSLLGGCEAQAQNKPDPRAIKAPLKCGDFQHVYHWPGPCGPQECSSEGGCLAICLPPPEDKCVDDMHDVTERDWQDLMERVRAVEAQLALVIASLDRKP